MTPSARQGAVVRCFLVPGDAWAPDVVVVALAEDGTVLASHVSSNESWARHDIGLTSEWKRDIYSATFPDGYTLTWLDAPPEGFRP